MGVPKNNRNKNSGKRIGKSVKGNFASTTGLSAKKTNVPSEGSIRLNKYIANSGVCTRREADLYISTGSVRVNGEVVTEMGFKVKPTDEVKFDGQSITPIKKSYILINKPKGYTVALQTANETKSVQYLLRNSAKSVLKPVGKMERNTTGLLLLSNDDSFLGNLNSSGRITQIFHVELNKNLSKVDFDKILEGVYIDNNSVKVHELSYIEDKKREVGIRLNSQKNKIVTRIFEKLGYSVEKLDRVVIGGLTKKDLPRGRWRELTKQELINLQMMA